MMQITHVATGALAGKLMPNPILALLAGILTHFLVDKIPHYWPATKKGKVIFVTIDYLVAFLGLAWFIYTGKIFGNMIYGVLGSVIVDIVIIGIPVVFKSKLGRWHTNRQPHSNRKEIIAVDMMMVVFGLFIALILIK
jgi:hypothetical protein